MNKKLRLLISVGLLVSFGLTTIWSTVPDLFWVQFSFLGIGLLIAFVFYKLDLTVAFGASNFIYIFCLLLLVLTLFFAPSVRGTTRWFLGIQTSEVVKPLLILAYAGFLVKHKLDKLKNLLLFIVMALIPVILVKIQPDLGSALVLTALATFMAVFSGLSPKKIIIFLLFLLLLVPLSPYFLKGYQLDRLESFINPYHDPRGRGYNVIQSVIAIGSGGIFGKGVRLGTQSHLNFLPERHTDFIFASFAEEFGLLGISLTLIAYFSLLSLLLSTVEKLKEQEHRLLGVGIIAIFLFQTVVNIGMNLGIIPVTGITLPLFSYGGSSLLSFMALLGMSARLLELTPAHQI
ncbi:MAG: FtsW/RodA/SpoVE family cell cycle protein [Patescibacteria group bacterium]